MAKSQPNTNSISNCENGKGYYVVLRWFVLAAFLLLLVVAILLADLFYASIKEAGVEGITVDVRGRRPEAEIELIFAYGSWFSSVEPQGMRCQLDSGKVEIKVSEEEVDVGGVPRYLAHVTCPDKDVESHAESIWRLLMKDESASLAGLIDSGTCEMDVNVRLGHILSFSRSVEISLEKFLLIAPAAEEDDTWEDEILDDLGCSASVCHLDKHTLAVCIPLCLPASSVARLPSVLRFKTPALEVHAQPTHTAEIPISIDAGEVTFNQEEEGNNSNMAVFSLSSQNRPLLDLFLVNVDATTIVVTLDGEGSFVEILMGRHHDFAIQHFEIDTGEFRESYQGSRNDSEELPKHHDDSVQRRLMPTEEFFQTHTEESAHCIGVNDNSDALGVGFCLLLDFPEDRLTLVGNMTLFDRSMLAFSTVSWATNTDYVRLDMDASVFMVGEERFVDILGKLLFDLSDNSNIQVDLSVENNGALWPFTARVLTTSSTDGPARFSMDIDEVTFVAEGDGMDGANGAMFVNWGERFAESFVMNLELDHGGSDFVRAQIGMSNDSAFVLSASSVCNWDNKDIWDASIAFTFDGSDESAFYGYVSAVAQESISLFGSLANNDEELVVTGKISNNRRDHINMRIERPYTQTGNFEMQFWSHSTWDEQELWALAFTLSLDESFTLSVDGDQLEERYMDMTLTESVSEFDISILSSIKSQEEGDDTTISTEIIHDGENEISLELQWLFGIAEKYLVIRGLSDCLWDEEKIWDSSLSFTWDLDEESDSGEISVGINEEISDFNSNSNVAYLFNEEDIFILRLASFQMEVEDDMYADSNGQLTLDVDNSRVLLNFEDNGKMDFISEIDSKWTIPDFEDSEDDGSSFVFQIEKINIRRNTDTYFDGTVTFAAKYDDASLWLDFDMPMASCHIDTDISYVYHDMESDFIATSWVYYTCEDEIRVDLTSRLALGIEDQSIELSSVDEGNIDFAANFTGLLYTDDNFTSTAFFRSKKDTYVDSLMSMRLEELDSGDFQIELLSETSEEAYLQMDVEMTATWVREDETLRMISDHMILGWGETTYLVVINEPSLTTKSQKKKKSSKKSKSSKKKKSSKKSKSSKKKKSSKKSKSSKKKKEN